jgi:hypothetical protein
MNYSITKSTVHRFVASLALFISILLSAQALRSLLPSIDAAENPMTRTTLGTPS